MSGNICQYFNCRASRRDEKIKMFRFPYRNEDICQRWILNSGNTTLLGLDLDIIKTKHICQKHFSDEDFKSEKKRYLKSTAIPKSYKENKEPIFLKVKTPDLVHSDIVTFDLLELMPEPSEESPMQLLPNDLVNPDIVKSEPLDLMPEPSEESPVQLPLKDIPERTYSKSNKLNLEDQMVCRLCLKVTSRITVTTLSEINLNYPGQSEEFKKQKLEEAQSITNMLRFCAPLLDYTLTFNPAVCSICCSRLQSTYEFITMCNASQQAIKQYKNLHVTKGIVNINDVVSSGIPKQFPPLQEVDVKHEVDFSPDPKKRKICEEFQNDDLKVTYPETKTSNDELVPNIKDEPLDFADMIKIEPEEEMRLIDAAGQNIFIKGNPGTSITDVAAIPNNFSSRESIDDKSFIKICTDDDTFEHSASIRRDFLVEAHPHLLYPVSQCLPLSLPFSNALYHIQNDPNLKRDKDDT